MDPYERGERLCKNLRLMYRGELACCKVLHARDEAFFREKRQGNI